MPREFNRDAQGRFISQERLREFEEALQRLTDAGEDAAEAQEQLAEEFGFTKKTDNAIGSDGEGGGAEGPSALHGFGGGVSAFGNGAAGVGVSILTRSASPFGAGANASDALESSALVAAKDYIQSNPELSIFGNSVTIPGNVALAASGVNAAFANAEQAGGRVGNNLAPLAELGINIPEADLDNLLRQETERVQRGNAFRARVNAQAISVENISSQVTTQIGQRIISLLEKLVQSGNSGGGLPT